MSKQPQPAPTAGTVGPCPTNIQISQYHEWLGCVAAISSWCFCEVWLDRLPLPTLVREAVLQLRRVNRDNLGIISHTQSYR